jgi:hypothetical protein
MSDDEIDAEMEAGVREAFALFDRDGAGQVSAKDAHSAFRALSLVEQNAEDALFREAGLDGVDPIDYVQFLHLCVLALRKMDGEADGSDAGNNVASIDQRTDPTRDAQWAGHAFVVSGNPRAGCNGAYVRAGEVNGATFGKNITNGFVLFWKPTAGEWRIASDISSAATMKCVSTVSVHASKAPELPEGMRQWEWLGEDGSWKMASVNVARVPEAEARRQAEVRVCALLRMCVRLGECACPNNLPLAASLYLKRK